MAVKLNHTIVWVRDKNESATFLAEMLGVGPPTTYEPFRVVEVSNEVSLDWQASTLYALYFAREMARGAWSTPSPPRRVSP